MTSSDGLHAAGLSRTTGALFAVVWIAVLLSASGCRSAGGPEAAPADSLDVMPETAVREIPLQAPLNDPKAEISGLAWHGDTLVILPQYPRYGAPEGERRLWGVTRRDLEQFVSGERTDPIKPIPIPFRAGAVRDDHTDYEGCEAVAFRGDRVFVVTESGGTRPGMTGHLLTGRVAPGLSAIQIDTASVRELPVQTGLANMSYEAMTLQGDTVIALFEANGAAVNATPRAYRLDPSLTLLDSMTVQSLEYRLTDATAMGADNRFWVINYFYPGERDLLQPAADSVALRYGIGRTHAQEDVVERLVEYQLVGNRIERTDSPPLWLRLQPGIGRNWEGIVRFGDGFLLATDRFPTSLLAYVERVR